MPREKKQRLKRRPDGRYVCKYKNLYFYGDTDEEALNARKEYKKAEAEGKLNQGEQFSVYAGRWVVAYKSHLTPKPYNQHVRILNNFIAVVGDKLMQNITPTDISYFYQQYNGMSESTICDVRDTIRGVFRAAVADGTIDRDPTMNIKLPKGTKGSHRAIEPEEREVIHRVQHKLRPAVMVMLYAGLRRGEVLALDVDRDVDFIHKTITVREAVRFLRNGKSSIVDPKTEAGTRIIPMIDILEDEIKGISGLVCKSSSGEIMTESSWRSAWSGYLAEYEKTLNNFPSGKRWYGKTKAHKAIIEAGEELPPWKDANLRPHDFRHSYCTMLYDLGIDLKTAMLWMGHADQTMILKIYAHLTAQRQEEAKKALKNAEKMLFRSQYGGQNLDKPLEPLRLNDSNE